jgi:transitional endoplasmic reticulum ATPase
MTNNNGYMTVREAVEKKILSERDYLYVIYLLTIMLKKILVETHGGGHFNVNIDTVKVLKEEDKDVRVELVDAEIGHEACNGKPEFDTEALNPCFLAPESFLGRFSPASDVYSLGIMLSYMRYGTYPFDINESMERSKILAVVKANDPDIEIQSRVDLLITKSIRKNASDRFKDVEDLGIALVQQLDIEMPNCFSCFSVGRKKRKIGDGIRHPNGCKLEKKEKTDGSSQVPSFKAKIKEREGDGFRDVAGMEDIKKMLQRDFVEIVSHRELAKEFGIMPSNMLFFGAPGTGKTFISMKLAEECGMAFCVVKPSDIGSIWAHGSVGIIKDLFKQAEARAKENERGCILLIDEMDSVCSRREAFQGNEHLANEVAEWLTQLNDCVEKNVFVIGTTNCIERIDKAIIRHGRIDQVLYIGLPDISCRKQLFELELSKRPHDEDINMEELARLTDGYTSSDISFMVKETARNAFEECLKRDSGTIVKISETMLQNVIKATRPSVSHDDVRRYEKMRDEFVEHNKKDRPRIGFIS